MDIGALSMDLNQMNVAQQSSVSVMKLAMNTVELQAVDLTKMLELNTKIMEQSINPHLGKTIDIKL
ncbi:YjfB family protein [Tissierella praeacuta]|uniref:YjfB family protein n=1 Tax=Tissierella praeacuta TaxID=43131 RepID=UPI003519AB70